MLGKITPSAKVENCQHDREHRRQNQNQALCLQVRYIVKTFGELFELVRIRPGKVLHVARPAINQTRGRASKQVIIFKDTQRRRKYLQSGQWLQYKEEQVADEKCLQRRHVRFSASKKEICCQPAGFVTSVFSVRKILEST